RDGTDVEDLRRACQEVVGDVADVRTVEADFQSATEVAAGLELGFDIGGAGALVIGLFLVYNVLSVSVAGRRPDIGIPRSVRAAAEEPADAARRVPVSPRPLRLLLHVGGVALLLALAAACVAGRRLLPARYGVFAGFVVLLVGLVAATPLLTAGLGRLLRPLL